MPYFGQNCHRHSLICL